MKQRKFKIIAIMGPAVYRITLLAAGYVWYEGSGVLLCGVSESARKKLNALNEVGYYILWDVGNYTVRVAGWNSKAIRRKRK